MDPTLGHTVAGVKIDDNRFIGRMGAAQLLKVAEDPRKTEDARQLEGNPQLENVRRIRMEVQRVFEGAKKKNVEDYASYIVKVHAGMNGMAPPIILFTETKLEAFENDTIIQVPYDVSLVAIDGETQLAARFEAARIDPDTVKELVPVQICHGLTIDWARQVFHDCNNLGVRPNAALALSMDARDPLTQVARDVASNVPFFKNRVNMVRRQLRGSDKEVLTFAALRAACVTFSEGIAGVKYGAKPVIVDMDRVESIRTAAIEWFTAVTKTIGGAMENRTQTVASTSSVMAAIGSLGHCLVEITSTQSRTAECERLVEELRPVKWEKSKAWEGIAGKFTPKGVFSTAGAKDAAYGVYSALSDPSSEGYSRIRAAKPIASTGSDSRSDAHGRELAMPVAG